jgi:hypothetical protein
MFPWEFILPTNKLRIEFVEISPNYVEIVRSTTNIEEVTDQNGETVPMVTNRTTKNLCLLSYKL